MYLSCSLCECCESQSAAFADVPLLSIHLNSVVAAWHFDPSPWTVGSMQRTVEFPAACRSPFSSFQLYNKECEAGKICWAMYGQANFFFFFFMEAKQLPWNWQVMYQWVGNWVWSLDHFPTTFRDFFVIVSVVSNVAETQEWGSSVWSFFSPAAFKTLCTYFHSQLSLISLIRIAKHSCCCCWGELERTWNFLLSILFRMFLEHLSNFAED